MDERKNKTVKRFFLKRRSIRILIWSFLHALILIILTFIELKFPFTTDEEMKMIQWTSGIKHKLLRQQAPDTNKFLFVCLSWDKMMVPKIDNNGFEIGNEIITDRSKLAKFLQLINNNPNNHKFLILDVRFEEKFKTFKQNDDSLINIKYKQLIFNDDLLENQLDKTKNYLVSYHKDSKDSLMLPALKAKTGLSDYETTDDGTIVKFAVVQADTARTTPLLMYQSLYKKKFSKGILFDRMDGKPIFNSFILDYRIIVDQNNYKNFHHAYLGEMVNYPQELFDELTKNRIIIVGDFEDRDIHQTIYGDMPGSIILLNAFLALENMDNKITIGFIIWLLIGYSFVSYQCFSDQNLVKNFIVSHLPFGEEIKSVVGEFLDYLLIFIVLSVISYYLFNIHLTILLLAIYMQVLDWIIGFIRKRREEKSAIKVGKNQISEEPQV